MFIVKMCAKFKEPRTQLLLEPRQVEMVGALPLILQGLVVHCGELLSWSSVA